MTDFKPPASNPAPPDKALLTMRIIWGAMLMGEFVFMVVAAMVIIPNRPRPDHPQPIFEWVSFGMLLTVIPAVFFVRTSLFKKAREKGALDAAAYSVGNIVFWAGCEGAAFFGVVVAILNSSIWPTMVNVVIAMALQVVTIPRTDATGQQD